MQFRACEAEPGDDCGGDSPWSGDRWPLGLSISGVVLPTLLWRVPGEDAPSPRATAVRARCRASKWLAGASYGTTRSGADDRMLRAVVPFRSKGSAFDLPARAHFSPKCVDAVRQSAKDFWAVSLPRRSCSSLSVECAEHVQAARCLRREPCRCVRYQCVSGAEDGRQFRRQP